MIKLPFIHEIADVFSRENFKVLQRFTEEDLNKMNFKFFKKEFSSAGTHSLSHGLKFKPTDVVLLAVNPSSATVTFNHESFTKDSITVTISGSCELRFLLGSYEER